MNLQIQDKWFIVTGASAGLGKAVAEALMQEGAVVLAVARRQNKLEDLHTLYPKQLHYITGDITDNETLTKVTEFIKPYFLSGLFLNAGGPLATNFLETELKDWDTAYKLVGRWKVELVKMLLPQFLKQAYGRILFSESSSLERPVENLLLSNSLRPVLVGLAKTISQEFAKQGLTANVIAPGLHETAAVQRLYIKKSELENTSLEAAKEQFISNLAVPQIGDAKDFASLAVWLLSPLSRQVTAQTFRIG